MKFNHNTLPTILATGVAAFAGGTLLSACGGRQEGNIKTETVIIKPEPVAPNPPLPTSKEADLLETGDKISEIPQYTPTKGSSPETYAGKKGNTDEDIVAITEPFYSRVMVKTMGKDPTKYGAAIILSEYPDGIYQTMALYERDTKEIDSVTESIALPKENQLLFATGSLKSGDGLTLNAHPKEGKSGWQVTLSIGEDLKIPDPFKEQPKSTPSVT